MSHANKPPANTTLRDFADLKRALNSAAKEAAAKAAQEKAERAKREAAQRSQEADSALFKKAVGQVNTLPSSGRVIHQTAKPKPVPASRQMDEKAVLQESLSDEFDVESLLETDESLSWRRPELGLDVVRKLRRGVWALQAELDLHGLRTDEARVQTSGFLREAQIKGLRCVRIIHGKGLGSPGRQPVLKDKVKRWLVQSDRVLAFVQARADEGGIGALIVLLQPGKSGPSPSN
ncbi:Smr/MutS family protein [Aquabacterium sp.]|uniref:Smr/MutS family protein n=1 Tax=Aquabacterium sp. TaxID=1872578 RepID=UPI0025BB7038|nr:Smr/MutS family protein [Aquabacterium sp.]